MEQAVDIDPYAEDLYRRMFRLHAQLGRPELARSVYRQLVNRLAELDAEPDAATLDALTQATRVKPRA